jgi:hypothetical protein
MNTIPVPKALQKFANTFTNEQIAKLVQACYRSNGNLLPKSVDSAPDVGYTGNVGKWPDL